MKQEPRHLDSDANQNSLRTYYGLTCLLIWLAISGPHAVNARELQPLATIRQAVEAFVARQRFDTAYPASVRLSRLDPRLQLERCADELAVFYANDKHRTGNTSVGVRCHSPRPWTIYLPVTIEVYANVLVARRALPRGSRLQKSELALEKRSVSSLRNGYYTRAEQVADMETKRLISAGTPLSPNLLMPRKLVRRGNTVTIVAQSGGFKVWTLGKALADGANGSRIPIKNQKSGRIVQGTVVGANLVEVNP